MAIQPNVVKTTAFDEILNGAGVILTSFDPSSPAITDDNILFATTGGITATATPSFIDYGEDIDNCPKNSMELKKIEMWECKIAGTAASITTAAMAKLGGAATTTDDVVTLRNKLAAADFADIWWVGEKTKANIVSYVKLGNALSSTGISIQTTDKEKGQFAFEFMGHYSLTAQDTVPFEYGEITITPTT